MSYRVATVDEMQDIAYRQDTHMRPVRHHLGITAFGTNAWTAANEGDRLMPEHEEDEGSEELYVVLRGRARFEIDGDTVDAPEGTLVFVPPQGEPDRVRRGGGDDGARDRQHGRAAVRRRRLGGLGGVPSRVRGRRLRGGDRPRPRDARGERVRRAALQPRLLRGAAGRSDDAIAHLRVAFEKRPSLRDLAKEDTDLDSLRDEPAFRELVG